MLSAQFQRLFMMEAREQTNNSLTCCRFAPAQPVSLEDVACKATEKAAASVLSNSI